MFEMFEIPIISIDRFVHSLYQNLGLRIESPVCRRSQKIAFMTYVEKICKIRQQLLHSVEKIKDITMLQDLDFSNERDICHFIQRHATLFDKFTFLSNTRILKSHLNNINTIIVQKVKTKRKRNGNMKKIEDNLLNKTTLYSKMTKRTNLAHKLDRSDSNLSSAVFCKEKDINIRNNRRGKCRKATFENSSVPSHQAKTFNDHTDNNILKIKNSNKRILHRQNIPSSMIDVVTKEIEMVEKFLFLFTRDTEFVKRNISITLHISMNQNNRNMLKRNQMLCHHAILCLIEPSKNVFVFTEDTNLSVIAKNYLLQGYKYHFEFQRDSEDTCIALLILSQWAEVLIRDKNTTIMHTIGGILGCSIENILVFSAPEAK